MERGFVNVNRFKHGRALKRNSKRRTDTQNKRKIARRESRLSGQDK
jgi:hypothetical protein